MSTSVPHRGLTLATALVVATALGCIAAARQAPDAAEKCRQDLAQRLHVPVSQVRVEQSTPVNWPDTALGLPKPGEMYAQVITPGFRLVLEAKGTSYVYTTGRGRFRYGGPMALWSASAIYRKREPNNPNMNGSLVQVSLTGTYPTVLLTDVAEYYPQPNGAILATRRTSRSGFDLLLLAPRAHQHAQTVYSAFSFGPAALSTDVGQWAAFVRVRAGGPWAVACGRTGQARPQLTDLPVGAVPGDIKFRNGSFLVKARVGRGVFYYQAAPGRVLGRIEVRADPFGQPIVLSSGEQLATQVSAADGQAVTRLVARRSSGEPKGLVTVPGFACEGLTATPDRSLVLMSGKKGSAYAAYAVDVTAPGPAVATVTDADAPVKLLIAAPRGTALLLDRGPQSRAPR